MTEEEWESSTKPRDKLDYLQGRSIPRKLQLVACACCRRIWHLLTDRRLQKAVEVSEKFVDGLSSQLELAGVHSKALRVLNEWRDAAEQTLLSPPSVVEPAFEAAVGVAENTIFVALETFGRVLRSESAAYVQSKPFDPVGILESIEQLDRQVLPPHSQIIRDIFGNPFRPVTFDPRWRTSDVVGLARAIYDDKAFERMPILADALMDAGCEDEQIIGHCRGEGPHVRGCWVVDLVLGKE